MNAHMQKSLDNLEAALATLLDSVTAYNPSSTAARTLVTAEEAFTQDLAMVAEHQALYAKLKQLKELSDSLDNKTLTLLQSLEATHAELLALPAPKPTAVTTTPSYSYPDNRVPYTDLLEYARKIAKFTQTAQLARKTEDSDVTGGEKSRNALNKEEMDILARVGGDKVQPFPGEDKMKAGALGWLSQGGEVKRERKGDTVMGS